MGSVFSSSINRMHSANKLGKLFHVLENCSVLYVMIFSYNAFLISKSRNNSSLSSFYIDKFDFYNIFINVGNILPLLMQSIDSTENAPLSETKLLWEKQQTLPVIGIELFNIFCSAESDETTVKCSVLLSGLVLLCKGSLHQKLALLMHIFGPASSWDKLNSSQKLNEVPWITNNIWIGMNSCLDIVLSPLQVTDMFMSLVTAMRKLSIVPSSIKLRQQNVDAAFDAIPLVPIVVSTKLMQSSISKSKGIFYHQVNTLEQTFLSKQQGSNTTLQSGMYRCEEAILKNAYTRGISFFKFLPHEIMDDSPTNSSAIETSVVIDADAKASKLNNGLNTSQYIKGNPENGCIVSSIKLQVAPTSTKQLTDAEWIQGLCCTLLEHPSSWYRLSPTQLSNVCTKRATISSTIILQEYYTLAELHVNHLAFQISADWDAKIASFACIPSLLFIDWVIGHPVLRYILRQLLVPLSKIGHYDTLNLMIPPASAKETFPLSKSKKSRLKILQKSQSILEMRRSTKPPLQASSQVSIQSDSEILPLIVRFIDALKLVSVDCIYLREKLLEVSQDNGKTVSLDAFIIGVIQYMSSDTAYNPSNRNNRLSSKFFGYSNATKRRFLTRIFGLFQVHDQWTQEPRTNLRTLFTMLCRCVPGSPLSKLAFLFDIFDADADLQISLQELADMILGIAPPLLATTSDPETDLNLEGIEQKTAEIQFAREVAAALDINGDASISKVEFLTVIANEPLLLECFMVALQLQIPANFQLEQDLKIDTYASEFPLLSQKPPSDPIFDFALLRQLRYSYSLDGVDAAYKTQARKIQVIDLEDIEKTKLFTSIEETDNADEPSISLPRPRSHLPRSRAVSNASSASGVSYASRVSKQAKYTRKSILQRSMDRGQFRNALRELWKCPNAAMFLVERIFDVMDADGSGKIDLNELYQGISQALRGDIVHRAEYFFSLFDFTGTGHLQSDEVLKMLLVVYGDLAAAEHNDDSLREKAAQVLRKLDEDGSGTVEKSEFVKAAELDPDIIESLSKLFGKSTIEASTFFLDEDDPIVPDEVL
jgi:Ca2+-binding EF-hand superfamily protein